MQDSTTDWIVYNYLEKQRYGLRPGCCAMGSGCGMGLSQLNDGISFVQILLLKSSTTIIRELVVSLVTIGVKLSSPPSCPAHSPDIAVTDMERGAHRGFCRSACLPTFIHYLTGILILSTGDSMLVQPVLCWDHTGIIKQAAHSRRRLLHFRTA